MGYDLTAFVDTCPVKGPDYFEVVLEADKIRALVSCLFSFSVLGPVPRKKQTT